MASAATPSRAQPIEDLQTLECTDDAPSRSPEGLRLIADLRRRLIEGTSRSDGSAAEILDILGRLESLLTAAEREETEQFAHEALGGSGTGVLVEVAHDMRSPLGSILLLVERMRRGGTGPVSPAQERHLGLVYSAAFGLSALASDMMELAHGGARLVGSVPVAYSLAAVMHAVRDVVQPIAEEKGLGLRFSAPPSDLRVGHPAALTRVLLNLVTNALKFTTNGSVTVIASAVGDDGVQFQVDDTGRGMPPAVLARVAVEAGRAREIRGTSFSSAGLGIAICRKLLHAMGGSLTFVELEPVGTRAAFVLRLASLQSGGVQGAVGPEGIDSP